MKLDPEGKKRLESMKKTLAAGLPLAGLLAGRAHGVEFVYRDWRGDEGEPDWTAMLYRQSYCGCVFSEYDRYCRTTTHLYPPGTKPPELEESGVREWL